MRTLEDLKLAKQVLNRTQVQLHLSEYDSIRKVEWGDECIRLALDTFKVKRGSKRDKVSSHEIRLMFITLQDGHWTITFDESVENEMFEPYELEHYGRRQSALEHQEQREFEKMCWRPGTAREPLDSYQRVWQDKSTPKMERYW